MIAPSTPQIEGPDKLQCGAELAAPIFVVTFRSERIRDRGLEIRKTRSLLKFCLRVFGFRCLSIREARE